MAMMARVLLCTASLLLALPSPAPASPTRPAATAAMSPEPGALREASACYGTVDTDLELECPEGEVINVTEIFHGGKPRSLNCTTPEYRKNFDRSCCRRQSRDCMLPVVGEMRRSLVAQCSGLTSCVTRTTWTNTNGHCDADTYLPQTNYMYISYTCHSGPTAKPTEREEVLVEPSKAHIPSSSVRPSSSTAVPTTTTTSPSPTTTPTPATTTPTTATTTPTTVTTVTPSTTTEKATPSTAPSTPATTTTPVTTTQPPTRPAPPTTLPVTTPPVATPTETLFMPDDLPVRPQDPPTSSQRTTVPSRRWPTPATSGVRPWDNWDREATATALPPLVLDFDVDRWTQAPSRDVTSGGPSSRSQQPMGVVQDTQEFAFTTGMLGGMTAAVLGMLFTIIAFLLYCGRKRRRHVMAKPQSSVWDFLLAHTITVRNFRRGYDNFSSTRTSISSEGEPPSPVPPPRSGWRPNITVGPAPSECGTSDDNVSLAESQRATARSTSGVPAASSANQQTTRAQQELDAQPEHSA